MKPTAILVNTSRGPIVDEDALIERLREEDRSAALDVYDEEPLPADHPLRTLGNVVLTPISGRHPRGLRGFYRDAVEPTSPRSRRVRPCE